MTRKQIEAKLNKMAEIANSLHNEAVRLYGDGACVALAVDSSAFVLYPPETRSEGDADPFTRSERVEYSSAYTRCDSICW